MNNSCVYFFLSVLSVIIAPTASSSCTTTGGGRTGAKCVFPFTYKDVKYTGCSLEDADDGKPWCSTKTDANGQHVGGQGQWGHCASNCEVGQGIEDSSCGLLIEGVTRAHTIGNDPTLAPWAVSIGYDDEDVRDCTGIEGNGHTHFCTGIIIKGIKIQKTTGCSQKSWF